MVELTTTDRIEIRASSLPSAPDCWRHWAADNKTLRPWLLKYGYIANEDRDNIGSIIGSACHEGIGAVMQARIDGYAADPLPHALRKFHQLTENVDKFDDKVTPDKLTAVQQIEQMIKRIMPRLAEVQPHRVEFAVEAVIDQEKKMFITGHPDCYETNGIIDDWKFGKNLSAYDAQLGAYSLMLRSTPGIKISGLRAWWMPRRSLASKKIDLQIITYDKYRSEQLAEHLVHDAATRIEKFTETGDTFAFTPNPNNKLCSKRWCSAWGTNFCEYGRPEQSQGE